LVSNLGKHRLILILIGLAVLIGASLPPFMIASCLTRQQTPEEIKALETLRAMTRGGSLPAEDVVARIESEFSRPKAAGLARIVRARIRLNAKDYTGAADLLDAAVIRDQTAIGDYALLMRANALEQTGKPLQARVVYEQLIKQYPSSLHLEDAQLRDAEILMKSGNASEVLLLLRELAAKDVPAALLLTARAHEQLGNPARALAAYRRLYFFAPASNESSQAAASLPRLGATLSAESPAEANGRADKLYQAR
jgi:tetratricopeptide (TPR) repeat protein